MSAEAAATWRCIYTRSDPFAYGSAIARTASELLEGK